MSDANDEAMTADEARLLADLAEALGPDTSPPGLIQRADGLLAFADIDQQLAELLDVPVGEFAGTRGPAVTGAPLVFQVADGSIVIEVVAERDRLTGQVLAGGLTEVDLEHLSGAGKTATVDELGRFSFAQPAAGPARLRLRVGLSRPVATDWFLL